MCLQYCSTEVFNHHTGKLRAWQTMVALADSAYFCRMYVLKKSLGQHFLQDEQICQKIVAQLQPHPGMRLAEIGPGGGALTKYLIRQPEITYKAIEIDAEKIEYLHAAYPALKGKIIHQDILEADALFADSFTVIGNFPYNISSSILFKILDWEPQVDAVIGMFQKEVAQRVAAAAGSRTCGILSILMQAFFEVTYLFDVPPHCFMPPPKVMSGILQLKNSRNPHGIENKKKFVTLVKGAFNQRRKTLHNALKSYVHPSLLLHPLMSKRAEQLTVADFVTLYQLNNAAAG
jgi:16S rRNA (adenine1518-N6/adenine1519-N6)-dimethyltransferase